MKTIFKKPVALIMGMLLAVAAVFGGSTVNALAQETIEHSKTIEGSGDDYTLKLTVTGKDKKDAGSTATTANGHADIVLVLDRTNSMTSSLGNTTRIQALKTAATEFVSGLTEDSLSNISVVSFGMTSTSGNTPVTIEQGWTSISSSTKTNINNKIEGLTLHNDDYSYDTTYYPGLSKANDLLSDVSGTGNNKYVIFFSDGENSDSSFGYNLSAMASTVKSKATVFTLGIPVPDPFGGMFGGSDTDPADLVNMASGSDKYFSVNNVSAMNTAFTQALQTIKTETTVNSTPMTNVTITDVLSEYVELRGDVSVSGNTGNVTAQSVNGKNVSVTLDSVPEGETVTVSIPVKPSQAARDAADAAGSSESRFKTNAGATLKVNYGSDEQTFAYGEEPEIVLTGAQQDTPHSDIYFKLKKTLEVKAGDKKAPNAVFEFTAVSEDATAPAISIEDVAFTSEDEPDANNRITKEVNVYLPAAHAFTKAGTYVYTIAETPDTYTGEGSMTYDGEKYTLTVKVCETADGMTYDDGNGTHITLVKNSEGNKTDCIEFNNEYDKDVEVTKLIVSKTVAGEHANKNREFDYSITFTDPGNAKDVKPAKEDESIEYGAPYSFKLSDGEQIEFTLPVGTKYTIVETGAQDYEAKVVITSGETQSNDSAANGASLTVSDVTVVKGENKADFTNTYVDNPLTGIMNGKGPLLIIIPAAIGAVVLLAFVNKKRAEKQNR